MILLCMQYMYNIFIYKFWLNSFLIYEKRLKTTLLFIQKKTSNFK